MCQSILLMLLLWLGCDNLGEYCELIMESGVVAVGQPWDSYFFPLVAFI